MSKSLEQEIEEIRDNLNSFLPPEHLDYVMGLIDTYCQKRESGFRLDELMGLGKLNLYSQPSAYKANKKLNEHIENRLNQLKLTNIKDGEE